MIFLFLPAKRQAASERRSRQTQKRQSAEQTHVTAATTGMATVQMLPESSASEPEKNRRYTMQFIGYMQDTASLPKTRTVQMQPRSSASEPGKNRRHTMQFIGHMQDTASLPKTHMVQMLQRRQRQMYRRKRSWRGMAEMATQKPNASERRSRQAQKGQDTEQTHVAAATAGMATVQMLPKSSASEPGKNKTHTMQFIGHMQDTASLPKTHTVQMLQRLKRQMCRRKRS